MTPRPLLAPIRPAGYRERPAGRRPAMVAGAVLALGAIPATALLQRDPPRVVPAAVSAPAPVAARAAVESPSRVERMAERDHVRAVRASRAGTRPAARPPARPMRTRTLQTVVFEQRGRASWYGPGFHGRRTASGERFDTGEMTAAHRTLPFGSRARVCTRRKCVTVRINDRGPFIRGRVVDLSRAAARALGIEGSGVARVTVTVVRTTTVTEPVPVAPAAPARPIPAARVARPAASAAPVSDPVATPVAVSTALAGAEGTVSAPGVAVVASMVFLLWAAPALAARRRREGLDFLR
ncbi:MAG TPA: septal ring lytic transglycosylase RlpA family protein [Mycobacteriales bacterium]|nr:septal ring lytic transglycosylase RlpA family protein [Mycobacteriales bacterium]